MFRDLGSFFPGSCFQVNRDQQSAKMVFRSEYTVRNQVGRLKELIGVRWRPALVAWAWQQSIVPLELEDEALPPG